MVTKKTPARRRRPTTASIEERFVNKSVVRAAKELAKGDTSLIRYVSPLEAWVGDARYDPPRKP